MSDVFIPYSEDMVRSRFSERLNRFLIRCELEGTGETADAHLPDSGRMKDILLPGKTVYLLPNNNPERKTAYTAVCAERPDGNGWVSINSLVPNKVAELVIRKKLLPQLKEWNYVRAEYKKGNSRWDHLLKNETGMKMVVEVKGVTLAKDSKAYFPDAVTARGTKHVSELAEIAKEDGWQAAILFVGQRNDISQVSPAYWIDPEFTAALHRAAEAGVSISACKCKVTPEGISYEGVIPVNLNTD